MSFGKRWPRAGVFHDTFICLAVQTSFNPMGDTVEGWKFPQEEVAKMESFIANLRELRTYKSVSAIIEAIVRWPLIFQSEDTESLIVVSNRV